tara:strand:+ start:1035 stop:1205 length:171 start_codon:yes stop_codon:yes gene_type:complete
MGFWRIFCNNYKENEKLIKLEIEIYIKRIEIGKELKKLGLKHNHIYQRFYINKIYQ